MEEKEERGAKNSMDEKSGIGFVNASARNLE